MLDRAVKVRHREPESRAKGIGVEGEGLGVEMEENSQEEGGVEEPVDFLAPGEDSREPEGGCHEDHEVEILAEHKAEVADQMVVKSVQKQGGADRFEGRAEGDKIKSNKARLAQKQIAVSR